MFGVLFAGMGVSFFFFSSPPCCWWGVEMGCWLGNVFTYETTRQESTHTHNIKVKRGFVSFLWWSLFLILSCNKELCYHAYSVCSVDRSPWWSPLDPQTTRVSVDSLRYRPISRINVEYATLSFVRVHNYDEGLTGWRTFWPKLTDHGIQLFQSVDR